jgi:hypothetical protein
MALIPGNDAVLILTDGGDSARTLSAYVKKITMNFKARTLIDTTCMGDAGRTWTPDDLEDGTFTVEFVVDDGTNTVWDTLFDATVGLRVATAAKAFEIGPKGTTATYPKFTGSCWLEDAPIPVAVGELVTCTATFKVEGAVTVGTYSA